MRQFPACPYLPSPPGCDGRQCPFRARRGSGRRVLSDSANVWQYLWLRGLASRTILKLDRALCADLRGDEPALRKWPLPYAAVVWFLRHTPEGGFAGNPRVHFQHLADRMKEPRREQRRWRIWACWSLCRAVLPHLLGDPKHAVEELAIERIVAELQIHGVPGQLKTWRAALKAASRERSALVH
jgi:hypothetical protein